MGQTPLTGNLDVPELDSYRVFEPDSKNVRGSSQERNLHRVHHKWITFFANSRLEIHEIVKGI